MTGFLRLLQRPRCRIAVGNPGPNGENWASVPLLPSPVHTFNGSGHVPRTDVRALADDENLYVRFDCALTDPRCLRLKNAHAPMGECERVWLRISPTNDFTRWHSFEAAFTGAMQAFSIAQMPGECSLEGVPDVWRTSDPFKGEWRLYHEFHGDRWSAEFVISWAALTGEAASAQRPPSVGFEYGRHYAEDAAFPRLVAASCRKWEGETLGPCDYPEALIGEDAVAPDHLELDPPRFGRNCGRLVFGRGGAPRAMDLLVNVVGDGAKRGESVVRISAGAKHVDFTYVLDRRFSSHLNVFEVQRLDLMLCEAGPGRLLYTACLPMDRHLGVRVDEPYGETAPADTPGPEGPREAWLDRVTRALPRLHRVTTAQGAPSDFCLMREDGSVAVNLMADDAWARLASIIEDRFATTEDRLVGAMALVGQKSVTNLLLDPMFFDAQGKAAYHSMHHEWMGPLSILRYGGGSAVCRAAVLARLLQQVKDPATGKPFVTRIVSLDKDGGPQQATRCYKGTRTLCAFEQQPGRAGVVAVEYQRGLTLLDPTGLNFCPGSDGALLTETQFEDGPIKNRGASPEQSRTCLSVDFDEVRHHAPDRLLSIGVFPELAPDEDGVDRPFDPRLRWSGKVIAVAKRAESLPVGGFVNALGKASVRDGNVRLLWDEKGLRVFVKVTGTSLADLKGRDLEMERVHLALDTSSDHATFRHFMASAFGERVAALERAGGMQTLFRNLTTGHWEEVRPLCWTEPNARFAAVVDGYEAVFDLSWPALGLNGAPGVMGLNVWIDSRLPHYETVYLAPPQAGLPADPASFAAVYLGDPKVVVAEVDFGLPAWGENTGRACLRNRSDRAVEAKVQAENHTAMKRGVRTSETVSARLPPQGEVEIEFPYFVDPTERMNTGSPQRIVLLAESGGKTVYRGSWEVGYCTAPGVYQRYGSDVEPCGNPSPGDPEFIEKKTRYICSRIPKFRRLTTRDGAPSDFFLLAEDGSVEFNLMAEGVLDRMGEHIGSLFDNDVDRVLGMYFLCYQPSVCRHMSGGHRFMSGAGPLSVLRGNFAGGGGNCGYHSRALAGMLAHLTIGGRKLKAFTVPVRGHVITGFQWRGSIALIDGDVGHFLLTADGRDFPTLEDLRAGHPVLASAGTGDLVRYYTFEEGYVRGLRGIRDDIWSGVFPPGGPKA